MYILCPRNIGDTLYVASLVKAFKQHYQVLLVVLIVKKNHGDIGELFPSVDGSIVSDELVEILDLYSRWKKIWLLDNYRFGYAKEDLAYRSEEVPYIEKNLLSVFKIAFMGLQEEDDYEKMCINKEKVVLEDIGGRTIIVMPHESSAKRLPISFWESLCEKLKENYVVYTNVKDETELPIRGTQAISKSLKNMAAMCEQCFAVISIRTGMCDLLAFTNANLIVLNTEYAQIASWDLKKVFTRENIVNMNCYDAFQEDVLQEQILSKLETFSESGEL